MKTNYHTSHNTYSRNILDISAIPDTPILLFHQWLEEAISEQIRHYNAMTLSTSSDNKKVHSRIVLLREISGEGLIFYSNFESNKGKEIKENNNVAISFFWAELERQIRIEGTIQKLNKEQSDKYFENRPRESQIASRISQQSKILTSRDELISKYKSEMKQFEGKKIPRPSNWGGYIVIPETWEFWQGQPARLNQRFLYVKKETDWEFCQLQP